MLTAITFIIILGLLIFVHELGHFLVAKKSGARVEEFGFGFPPRLLGVQRVWVEALQEVAEKKTEVSVAVGEPDAASGQEIVSERTITETERISRVIPAKRWRLVFWRNKNNETGENLSNDTIYSLNLIPLGGFVKILGEDGQEKNDPKSFASKKIWQRALILAAGVAMNILLAIFLFALGFGIGLPTSIDDSEPAGNAKVQFTFIVEGSPAQTAGLKVGDEVVKMFGPSGELNQIDKVEKLQNFTDQNLGQTMTLEVLRGNEMFKFQIVPRVNPPPDEGAMGVGLARVALISYPWYQAIYKGFVSTFEMAWLIISTLGVFLWHLISQGRVAGDIAGPVGIYTITGQVAKMGFIYILQLTALLSINLAIINILPFPALDGGRLLFLLIEKIKGSPVSQRVERAVHSAGFIFLIVLMVLITVRDVIKLF